MGQDSEQLQKCKSPWYKTHCPIRIVVVDHGFVYVGRYHEIGDEVQIDSARCLIRWGTSEHLGQLKDGPLKDTKLGSPCMFLSKQLRIVNTIEVDQDAWEQFID